MKNSTPATYVFIDATNIIYGASRYGWNGDFYWVLEYLIRNEKKLKLIAVSSQTARELKQLVKSNFIPLNNLRSLIEYLIKK
ncbi:hypothetical protein KKE34_03285 [Patescibacteria group bacterium]|nr:hypothetical protein [Patescibacteria group bacterium]MBU1885610.1 hypothetical protein [Patescibacteria group bacterium]